MARNVTVRPGRPSHGVEEPAEFGESSVLERVQNLRHALPNRQAFPLHVVVGVEVSPSQGVVKRQQQLPQVDLRRLGDQPLPLHLRGRLGDVPLHALQRVHVLGRRLEALVLLQAADQFGAGVLFLLAVSRRPRQQHSRLDLGQGGRHDQVFARQFELHVPHEFDIACVLLGHLGDGDVENVQVLPPD